MHILIIPTSFLQSQRFDMVHLNSLFSIKKYLPRRESTRTRDIAMFVVVRMSMKSRGFAILPYNAANHYVGLNTNHTRAFLIPVISATAFVIPL